MPRPDAPPLAFTAPSRTSPSLIAQLTAVSLAMSMLFLLWAQVDPRLVEGAPVWLKPLKFALSLVLLFGTIALVESRLSAAARTGLLARATGMAMAAALIAEMVYITWRAARAEASHFNVSTAFAQQMFETLMFGGAVTLVVGVGVYGWLALRDRDATFGPALRRGIGWGFLLSFALTLVTASAMGMLGRHVGLHPEGGPVIPLLGWSGVTGDLRPAHFAALHSMQALPLLGIWLDRGARSARLMIPAALVWTALTLSLFVQALFGLPLIRLG